MGKREKSLAALALATVMACGSSGGSGTNPPPPTVTPYGCYELEKNSLFPDERNQGDTCLILVDYANDCYKPDQKLSACPSTSNLTGCCLYDKRSWSINGLAGECYYKPNPVPKGWKTPGPPNGCDKNGAKWSTDVPKVQ